MSIARWWSSSEWLDYERLCGEPAPRADVLATASWQTRIIDLSRPIPNLWRDVRKSYRQIVTRIDADSLVIIGDANSFEFYYACREMHIREAGRETRPAETWRIQADWLESGRARCFLAYRNDTPIGFAYVLTIDREAYYFSAASDERDISHAIQWHAIEALKESGKLTYELGWQGQATDEKGQNIEFFRRGFGGVDVPARLEVESGDRNR